MEKKTIRRRIVPIHGKTSRFKKFWRRHPYLYSIAATVAVFAVITIAVTLIQSAANSLVGNNQANQNVAPPIVPPVPAPPPLGTSTHSETTSPDRSTAAPDWSTADLGPSTAVPEPSPTLTAAPTEDPKPHTVGSCLAGDFNSSEPQAVQQVSCSSDGAYEVLASYPDETDPNVCKSVEGAEEGYVEERLIDGAVASSYVYCLGHPVG